MTISYKGSHDETWLLTQFKIASLLLADCKKFKWFYVKMAHFDRLTPLEIDTFWIENWKKFKLVNIWRFFGMAKSWGFSMLSPSKNTQMMLKSYHNTLKQYGEKLIWPLIIGVTMMKLDFFSHCQHACKILADWKILKVLRPNGLFPSVNPFGNRQILRSKLKFFKKDNIWLVCWEWLKITVSPC